VVVQNELALRVRIHELAFNNETKQFVSKPNKITATHTRSEIQKKMSRGAERKFGKQIVEYTNKEILKNYVAPTIKRDTLGKSTKEILDTYTKARLGRAIGRAAGNAIRGAASSRTARGVARRFISGTLDPRKRRDHDGDGLIFDGTWREMPDPNRFVSAPRASETSTGMLMEGTPGLRRRGGMNLPGGGGVGIRSTDPEENRRVEDSLRAQDELRQQFTAEVEKIVNTLRDAGLTIEKPKRGKRERRLSDGTSLRSSGATANEPPRAAAAVQMAFDTRNSRKASKMTYDPQTNSVEVTYKDGRMKRFDNVPYDEARRAGADDAIDRLITDMETGRIGKESKEPIMGIRSSGRRPKPDVDMTDMTPEEREANRPSSVSEDEYRRRIRRDVDRSLRRADEEGLRSSGKYTRGNMSRLTPQSQSRVDNAKEMLDSGRVDNVRQLTTQVEGLDLRISRNQNYLDSLRDTLRRLGPGDKRRPDTEKDFERAEQELGVDMAIRDLTQQRLKKIDRGPKPGGLRSSGNRNTAEKLPDEGGEPGRYDDMPSVEDAVKKLTSGDRMSADELEYLEEVTDRILDDPDTPENIRDSMLDLKNQIAARRKNGGNTLRSSGGGGRRRATTPTPVDVEAYLKDWLENRNRNRPYMPGQDTGQKTPVDDIPDLSDEAIRDEIDRIENRPRVYDGNVTAARMDGERKAALERELQRRRRGGGRRKPTQNTKRPFSSEPKPETNRPLSTGSNQRVSNWLNSPEGRRSVQTLRSSGAGREEFGSTATGGFKYPNASQRKRIFNSKEDVDDFIQDLKDDYEARRRRLEQELGFEDGYYMDDEELIEKFMDDYGMSRGEARQEMRKYRRNYDLLEKEQEIHERRLDELDAEKSRLPHQQEIDDPIELDTNGFPKNPEQTERFNELMEEGNPVFKARKRPTRKPKETEDKRDPEVEDLISNIMSSTAGPSEGSKRSLRSSGAGPETQDRPEITSITKLIENDYDSMLQGGADMDSGMREVARTVGLNEKQTEKLSKIAYTLDRQRDELPQTASDQKRLVDGIMEERFGNQPLNDDQKASVREALSAFIAYAAKNAKAEANGKAKPRRDSEPDDIQSMIRRLQSGQQLSDDELDMLDELKNIVRGKRNVTEDELDAMADLEKEIQRARRAPRRQFEPAQQALFSRGNVRTDVPLSSRRSLARTERAAKPRGTTLRSAGGDKTKTPRTPAPKSGAPRGVGAGPGGKAGHARMTRTYGRDKKGSDGKVFDSLTPEQKDAVKKTLVEEVKPALDKKLKGFFSKYWKARSERGSKKQSLLAVRRRAKGDARGRYDKVAEDTPLESADIYEMLYRLDGQVSEGLLEKFEVSDKDSRELKLTEDGEAKVSAAKNGYTVQQRALDDAQTIMNMIEDGDFSALEHLHPATKKKIADVIKKNGGEVPKGWIDSESSVAGWAGGEGRTKAPDAIDLEKERGIGKKKKEKRLSLFQRLRRVDPERERKVELRAARRQGRLREGIELDPDLQLKRRILRGRAMKRTFMSRFRKNRDPETLATDMRERREEVAVLKTNATDGKVEVTDGYVDLLHALDQGLIGINEKKRKGASEEEVESEHKALLRRLWENSGFSETPIQLKEDEVKLLLDAGWQPIMRGTGHEKVNSETYVEQFITSEGRFIPGQGGSAFGIGEYFSYPGEWGSYHGANPTDRHTLVALLPPTSTIVKQSEIAREHANLGAITTKISDAFKIIGGRDATKAMEPEELVAEIDKAVPDLSSDASRTGQIIKQLRDRLEALSKLPKTNDEERGAVQAQKEKILNSLDYLQRFSKQRSPEMIAPLIGVDAIDTNENDSSIKDPILLHNRTSVAVLQVPTTYDQGLALVSGPNGERRPKAWLKWKRKSVETPEREAPRRRSPRRARRAQPPAPQPAATPNPPTPTPSTPTPSPSTPTPPTPSPDGKGAKAPVDVSSWTSSRPQSTGSNPATLLTAPDGTQYYTKLPKGTPDDKDRMETEALASELYKLAGIQSADVQMGTRNGQPVTISRMVQSRMPNSQGDQDEALKGFVVDAWLANWDAPLNDNIKIDSNGNAVRLDVGGSLDFRAQGARKGKAWGNTVGEIESMKKGGTYDFKKITDAAIKQQAKALGNVTDTDIRATVSRIVSDPARAKALADTLIARRDDIVKRYA